MDAESLRLHLLDNRWKAIARMTNRSGQVMGGFGTAISPDEFKREYYGEYEEWLRKKEGSKADLGAEEVQCLPEDSSVEEAQERVFHISRRDLRGL